MLYIILALEIVFYSLFIKFSKKDGHLLGYGATFLIGTIEMMLLDSNKLVAYLLFFIISLLGIRLLARTKVYNYDVLVLFAMCVFKLIVEFIFTATLHIFINDVYIVALIVSVIKTGILLLLRNKLNTMYIDGMKNWNNNNFYIRYFTSILIMIYIIATCVLLVIQLI